MASKYTEYKGKNLDWDDAVAKYEEYNKVPYRPAGHHLPEHHCEDANQSVKWNREFVKNHNEAWDAEKRRLNAKRNAIIVEAQFLVKCLMSEELEWKLSDSDIDRLFEKWYSHYHSDGFKYMCSQIQSEISEITEMDWFRTMKVGG